VKMSDISLCLLKKKLSAVQKFPLYMNDKYNITLDFDNMERICAIASVIWSSGHKKSIVNWHH
jgi:hypothetical protein